jgi:hypothetical protein
LQARNTLLVLGSGSSVVHAADAGADQTPNATTPTTAARPMRNCLRVALYRLFMFPPLW